MVTRLRAILSGAPMRMNCEADHTRIISMLIEPARELRGEAYTGFAHDAGKVLRRAFAYRCEHGRQAYVDGGAASDRGG